VSINPVVIYCILTSLSVSVNPLVIYSMFTYLSVFINPLVIYSKFTSLSMFVNPLVIYSMFTSLCLLILLLFIVCFPLCLCLLILLLSVLCLPFCLCLFISVKLCWILQIIIECGQLSMSFQIVVLCHQFPCVSSDVRWPVRVPLISKVIAVSFCFPMSDHMSELSLLVEYWQ